MGTLRPSDPLNTEWVAIFFIAVVAALAWIHAISPRKWRLLVQSVSRLRLGRQTIREDVDLRDRTLIALLVIAAALIGLFSYQWSVNVGRVEPAWLHAVEAMMIVLVVITAQITLVRGAGFLFQADGGGEEYIYTFVLLVVALGLILLPIALLVAYRPEWRPVLLAIGALAMALMVLYRWLRAVAIGSGSGTPFRYIFLYLCALEILPVAIAFRTLQQALPPDVRPH